ncbi:MAG: MerR family transcriptional regulator [Bacillota bacterium]
MDNYLSLKQVSTILEVEPSTVRFWEKEFAEFLHLRTGKGIHKRFSEKSLETLAQIKDLLQTEQYTIKGAKRRLEMDRSLNCAIGVDHNFKTTVFFMFSAIIQELQAYRLESRELAAKLADLQTEKDEIEEKLAEEQSRSLLDFIKNKLQIKKSSQYTFEKTTEQEGA